MRRYGVLLIAVILSILPVTVNPHDVGAVKADKMPNQLEAEAVLTLVAQAAPVR